MATLDQRIQETEKQNTELGQRLQEGQEVLERANYVNSQLSERLQ